MIILIIGQNAIGKSVYIRTKAKEALQYNAQIITNFWDKTYLKNRDYNEERVDLLRELFDADKIEKKRDRLQITSDFPISNYFNDILTAICKEGEELYLDEPEYGLYSYEIGYLVTFISRVSDTFKYIEIVTHSELFLAILEAERNTVVLNDNKEYVLTCLRGSDYETID